MTQFSEKTDERLHKLSRTIGELEENIKIATEEKDNYWEEVISLFGEFDKKRFIADDGRVLGLQEREAKPKLDEQKLYEHLVKIYGKSKVRKVWANITRRVVDPNLLEKAMQERIVDAAIVVDCVEDRPPTIARVHPVWSQEDYNRAVILGVEKNEKSLV